jgi:hypothetical protein
LLEGLRVRSIVCATSLRAGLRDEEATPRAAAGT